MFERKYNRGSVERSLPQWLCPCPIYHPVKIQHRVSLQCTAFKSMEAKSTGRFAKKLVCFQRKEIWLFSRTEAFLNFYSPRSSYGGPRGLFQGGQIHDLSECRCLYDLGRYMSISIIQTMVLTQITHIPSYLNLVQKPSRTTLTSLFYISLCSCIVGLQYIRKGGNW